MKFPITVAKRYLLAKKSHQAVNVISAVSVAGVAVATMAIVIVLSVFNGLEGLAHRLFSTFDPDLKITATQGKTFVPDTTVLRRLAADPAVKAWSLTIEENVLVRYGEQQEIAMLKGVDGNYTSVTGIDTMMLDGKFQLYGGDLPQAIVGAVLAGKLRIGLNFLTPIHLHAVRNKASRVMSPSEALSHAYLFPIGVFDIDEEVNAHYMLVPLDFAQHLLESGNRAGAVEVKLSPGCNADDAQRRVTSMFGPSYTVKNASQQKAFYFRMLKYEKWIGFMILAFVLLIASFNVVSSISMLMIEKKSDMSVLQSMGADKSLIGNIFVIQGWMIVLTGALAGMFLGAVLCWVQMLTGFVPFATSGTFVVDSYPVALRLTDFAMIMISVIVISTVTIYLPVKYFVKAWLS